MWVIRVVVVAFTKTETLVEARFEDQFIFKLCFSKLMLLSDYCMLGTVPHIGDTAVSLTGKIPVLMVLNMQKKLIKRTR